MVESLKYGESVQLMDYFSKLVKSPHFNPFTGIEHSKVLMKNIRDAIDRCIEQEPASSPSSDMEHKMWDEGWRSGYYRAIEDHVSPHDPERGKEILSGEIFPPPIRPDLIAQPTSSPPTEPGPYWMKTDKVAWHIVLLQDEEELGFWVFPVGTGGNDYRLDELTDDAQWFPIKAPS